MRGDEDPQSWRGWPWAAALLLILGLGARLYLVFQLVSADPFHASYSESARVYESYQVYAPLRGEARQAWPWLDPGRAVLEGAIWLLPQPSIVTYRLWVSLLSFLATLAASFGAVTAARRVGALAGLGRARLALLAVWGIVFLSQGPIYPHLLLSALPVLFFYRPGSPRLTLAAVVAGSLWAGLARVNWYLAPALVAFILYALSENPIRSLRWFAWPAAWALAGAAASLAVSSASLAAAGMPGLFDPALDYAFDEAKLLPNEQFPPGLLLGALAIAIPPAWILLRAFLSARSERRARIALAGAALAVLFAGGTLVSLRVGGGYDLHNYDVFLLVLGVSVLLLGARWLARGPALAALAVVPLAFLLAHAQPPEPYDAQRSAQTAAELAKVLRVVESRGAKVLMVDHRQLALLGGVKVTLRPEYDKTTLMEMAMANNAAYLAAFKAAVERRDYDVIVSEPLVEIIRKPGEDPFWYENNAWVTNIAYPVLSAYRLAYEEQRSGVAVYAAEEWVETIRQALGQ